MDKTPVGDTDAVAVALTRLADEVRQLRREVIASAGNPLAGACMALKFDGPAGARTASGLVAETASQTALLQEAMACLQAQVAALRAEAQEAAKRPPLEPA